MSFEAKYAGWCESCGARFGVGDQITGDPLGGYIHDDCHPVEPAAPPKICPNCWLVIAPSGACGCEPM